MTRRGKAIALVLALLAASASAAPESAATRHKVQAHLDRAAKKYAAKDFGGALAELKAAEKLSDLAVVRYNVARCYEELGRSAEALAAFESYLALTDSTAGAADRKKRAGEEAKRLEPKVFGSVSIRCSVASAKLTVAHLVETAQPCPLTRDRVKPGSFEVHAEAPGFVPVTVTLQVKAGERADLPLELIPVPPPLPDAPAKEVAAAPPEVKAAPAPAPKSRVLAWSLFGAGGLAAGSAVLFGALGNRQNLVIKGGGIPSGQTIEQQAALGGTFNTVAVASGVVAVAAVAGGAAALWWPKGDGVTVTPVAGPDAAGVTVSGHW